MESNARRPLPIPPLVASLALVVAAAACASAAPPVQSAAPPAAGATQSTAVPDPAAWTRVAARPELPAGRPLAVAFVLVDGIGGAELAIPLAVFDEVARRERDRVETFVLSPDGEPVTTSEGLRIGAGHAFADAPPADVLVIPGAGGPAVEERLVEWLRRRGSSARWTVALGTGAFALAEAGLLEGRAATTVPAEYDRLARSFPAVDLRVNVSFVHDGWALTSQGGGRSFDVALYLVDHLFGAPTAQAVADQLRLTWPPDSDLAPRYVVMSRPVAEPRTP